MSTERQAHYMSYHQQSSRNLRDALYDRERHETHEESGVAAAAVSPDDGDSAGLSFGEREPRARRSRPSMDRVGRSREELDIRGDQNGRPMDPSESDRPAVTQVIHSQDRDAWRENRRHHQSSHILMAFGSSSPRWESSADMGRRCTSSSQLDAAGPRTPVDEEPTARRHRSDLTPTAPPGHSFRDPPPARHRSPGVSGSGSASSRPSSSLSQQGGGAAAGGGAGGGAGGARPSPLRLRTGARRPRPSSIAGMPTPRPTADSGGQLNEAGRVSSRSGSSSTPRRPLPTSAPSSEARRPPPAAAAASPRRTPAQVKADDARKKKQRSKSGTPQPEARPAASQQLTSESSAGSEPSISPAPSGSSVEGSTEQPRGSSTDRPAVPLQPERTAAPEQTDSSTPSRKAGYDSETAARAALAEKRRRAREEVERQAELERQREEEEERQEQERHRQEVLMMEEAGRAEQERLQKAIQETEERRAEEERLKQREEEQRKQKELEEEETRQEAELARIAAAEKLQREEVERKARRSRVAAIMSRTRNSTNNNNAPEKTDSSEEEQTGSTAPHSSDDQAREENSSMESQTSENLASVEEPREAEPAAAPVTPEVAIAAPGMFELKTETTTPWKRSEVNQEVNQEPEQEPELPMSTDSSPVHSTRITSITNGLNGTNGLDNSSDRDPATDGDDAHQNGSLPPLHTLVLKSSAPSDDEDSINSNVSPRPGLTPQQDLLSLGLTGGGQVSQELAHPVHTTELVQL